MAWFKVDERALDDWRIRELAKQLGITHGDAFLLCCRLWNYVNQRGAGAVTPAQVDRVVGVSGFADALVDFELADDLEDGSFRVRGDERAAMAKLSEAQRAKARARWDRLNDPPHAIAETESSDASGSAGSKPAASLRHRSGIRSASVRHPSGNADLDLDQDREKDRDPESLASPPGFALRESNSLSGSSPDAVVPSDARQQSIPGVAVAVPSAPSAHAIAKLEAADWLAWFNASFDRRFELRPELVADVRKLLRDGFTQTDMRKVAVFKRKQWADPKMSVHLVPQTLLRPTKFGAYLDEAKSLLFRDEDDPERKGPTNGKAH